MDITKSKYLFRGFKIDFCKEGPHFFGGSHKIENAFCFNCRKPLILHFTLNTQCKEFKRIFKGFKEIPFLYCMRCVLCYEDFCYQLVSEGKIQILIANKGEICDYWEEEVGLDVFPKRHVSLEGIPDRVQMSYDKLNNNLDISDTEMLEICKFTGQFAPKEVGGYAFVDVINQIGGRSFLCQRQEDPMCVFCGKKMFFLSSFTNDKKNNFVISLASVQIIFFFCPKCFSFLVQHRI